MRIKVEGETYNTKGMNREQLCELRDDVLDAIASIEYQLGMAKSGVHQSGDYADPEWYRKATYALRIKKRESQSLQRAIADKPTHKALRGKEFSSIYDRCIVDIVKKIVEPDAFEKITAAAEKRAQALYAEVHGEEY